MCSLGSLSSSDHHVDPKESDDAAHSQHRLHSRHSAHHATQPRRVNSPTAVCCLCPVVQNQIFRLLQKKDRVQLWLYENTTLRIEGIIIVTAARSTQEQRPGLLAVRSG